MFDFVFRVVSRPLRRISKRFSRAGIYKTMRRELQGKAKDIAVLNIGSGGDVAKVLTEGKFTNVVSVDISEDRNPDIIADACDMKAVFKDATFDLVFLMEVLEHIPTPALAVAEIHRVLKPGGILVLSTPFAFPEHDIPHDYYRYTQYGLRYLLAAFSNINLVPRNDDVHASLVILFRLLMSPKKRSRLVGLFLMPMLLLLYPIFYVLSKLSASFTAPTGYIVVASKK